MKNKQQSPTRPKSARDGAHADRLNRLVLKETAQFLSQSARQGIPAGGIFFQALQADGFQVMRHSRVELARRDGIGFHHLAHRGHRCLPSKRRPARQQFVQDRPQRINVAGRPDLVEAYCNLGGALQDTGDINECIRSFREVIRLQPDFADVMRRAEEAGVTRIISIGTSIESSRRAIALAERS